MGGQPAMQTVRQVVEKPRHAFISIGLKMPMDRRTGSFWNSLHVDALAMSGGVQNRPIRFANDALSHPTLTLPIPRSTLTTIPSRSSFVTRHWAGSVTERVDPFTAVAIATMAYKPPRELENG